MSSVIMSAPDKYVGFVLSNPIAELAVNNARYIRECTELHLAHRGIEVLWGFDRFTNLSVLWVNDNKVRADGRPRGGADRGSGHTVAYAADGDHAP